MPLDFPSPGSLHPDSRHSRLCFARRPAEYTLWYCSRAVIDTLNALADLAARIDEADRVGVDTEADSLHCYHEKVCLLQVGLPDSD